VSGEMSVAGEGSSERGGLFIGDSGCEAAGVDVVVRGRNPVNAFHQSAAELPDKKCYRIPAGILAQAASAPRDHEHTTCSMLDRPGIFPRPHCLLTILAVSCSGVRWLAAQLAVLHLI